MTRPGHVSPASRVGYVLAGRFAQEVALLKTVTSGGTSHLFQAVLPDFLEGSSYGQQLRRMRPTLVQRIEQAITRLGGLVKDAL